MMIIGIDIDNTITNTEEKALEYVKKYNPNLINYNLHNVKLKELARFYKKYLNQIFMEVTLKENVKETLENFHKRGYKIIFITARSTDLDISFEEITKEYLKSNNIIYDKLIMKSSNKGIDAERENVDIFIDDKEDNLDSVASKNIECLKFVKQKTNNKYQEFDNWLDIEKYIISRGK